MKQVVEEIDTQLPALLPDQSAYPIATLESSLPYTRDCIKENFRITPVFTMPLARRVMAPEGITIDGRYFPRGVSTPPETACR